MRKSTMAMMDGRWVPRGGWERDEVRNDGVGLDGVCLGGYGAFLFVPRPPTLGIRSIVYLHPATIATTSTEPLMFSQ